MKENSLLERLVEQILLELFEAQKASNKASARLAEEYLKHKDPGAEELFPIPNSCIKSFDFSLKFLLKDIGIILTDDAILQINQLLDSTWKALVDTLYTNDILSKSKRKLLLRTTPIPDFKTMEFDAEIKNSESIADAVAQNVISIFASKLSESKKVNHELILEILSQLDLQKKVNQIIMDSENHQSMPLSKIKASFDLNKLDDLTEEMICDIKVHVVMRNFDAAYVNEISNEFPNKTKRRLLALK